MKWKGGRQSGNWIFGINPPTVLADTEDMWRARFKAQGGTCHDPTLVLFRRCHAHRLRHRPVGDGPVLLPR